MQLFSSSYLEINFDDGVCDIVRRNPINTLYDYLKEYGYTITSVQTEEYGLDVLSKEYPTIISVTLAKE